MVIEKVVAHRVIHNYNYDMIFIRSNKEAEMNLRKESINDLNFTTLELNEFEIFMRK